MKVNEKTPLTNNKANHAMSNTVHNIENTSQIDPQAKEYEEEVKFSIRGQKSHILFGHGINQIRDVLSTISFSYF